MTAQFHIPTGQDAMISIINLDALCEDIAARWCGSFGIKDQGAIMRLRLRIIEALNDLPRDVMAAGRIEALIHDLAREAIERWFALQNVEAKGRIFDRLRHRFLLANRTGRFTQSFLDPDVTGTALADALASARFVATPEAAFCEMPRQRL